ncbi:MAG TPA: hypothetical protein VGW12_13135 [Pyrinomonadaceae bacterium]|nr:hypothetical protein [Pyrinomonadaceae bacterium]
MLRTFVVRPVEAATTGKRVAVEVRQRIAESGQDVKAAAGQKVRRAFDLRTSFARPSLVLP